MPTVIKEIDGRNVTAGPADGKGEDYLYIVAKKCEVTLNGQKAFLGQLEVGDSVAFQVRKGEEYHRIVATRKK